MTFEERCRLSEQCLPEAPYREMLTKLHNEMLEALAQPEQEPVACRFCRDERGCWAWQCNNCGEIDDSQEPTPPQRTWVGLTNDQRTSAIWTNGGFGAGALWAEKQLEENNK